MWQAVCKTHGLVTHAARRPVAVMIARLHEWDDETCVVVTGGLRCMFCLGIVEADLWPPGVQLTCQMCYHLTITGRLPAIYTVHSLSYFATEKIGADELIHPDHLEWAALRQQTGSVNY